MATHRLVVTLSCPDRTGIVATITGRLAALGASITEAAYHADTEAGWFVTRQVVDAASVPGGADVLRVVMGQVAAGLEVPGGDPVRWQVRDAAEPPRVVLLVSKESHCLHDLLGRVWGGELDDGRARGHRQPRGAAPARRGARRAVPPRPVPVARRGRRGPHGPRRGVREGRRPRRRARPGRDRAGAVHAGADARALRPVGRAGDQHPPQLPALVRRRAPVPPGARPRGEARSARRATTSPRTSTPARSSSRTSAAWTTPTPPRTWSAAAATSRSWCWPAGCAAHLEDRVQVHAGRTVVFR